MGQLRPVRFKTNHKASGGLYAGQGYVDIAHKKIKDKREFILGTNAQGRKVYGLSFFEDKGKFFFIFYFFMSNIYIALACIRSATCFVICFKSYWS